MLGGACSDFSTYRLHSLASYLAAQYAEQHTWLNVATQEQLRACLNKREELTSSRPLLSQLHVLVRASKSPCVNPARFGMVLYHTFQTVPRYVHSRART